MDTLTLPVGVNAILEKTYEFFPSYKQRTMYFWPLYVEEVCGVEHNYDDGSDTCFSFMGYITYKNYNDEVVRERVAVWRMNGCDRFSFWGQTPFATDALIKMIESV